MDTKMNRRAWEGRHHRVKLPVLLVFSVDYGRRFRRE